MSNRTLSPLGVAHIKTHEGFVAAPVLMSNHRFVIGYGHVCDTPPRTMNKTEAANLLLADLAPIEQAVNEMIERPLTQSQFDALVSFAFSVGLAAFAKSDVLRRVREGEFPAAACAMDAWRRSGVSGETAVYEVLVRRRAAEKALLLSDSNGAPSAWLRPEIDHAASILGTPSLFAPLPKLGESAEPAVDNTPLLLTQTLPVQPVATFTLSPAKKPRGPLLEQAGLATLCLGGLTLVGMACSTYLQGAPLYPDLGAIFLLGAPGVAATLAGIFFLTRRARPVFA